MKKLPISALIVSCNEGHLLENCLKSIQFCDEIVVVDLESKDNSVEIAKKWVTKVISHPRVPVVEIIRAKTIPLLKNDWVMLTDPDERTSNLLKKDIFTFFSKNISSFGEVRVPIQYYFKKKALKGTIWGGIRDSRYLINKQRVEFSKNVYQTYKKINNTQTYTIAFKNNNILHHFWMKNYSSLFEKHKRYLSAVGKSKFDNGERYFLKKQLKSSIYAFIESFYYQKGYLDRFTGLFLSFFWVWYVWKSWSSLRKHEKKVHLEN